MGRWLFVLPTALSIGCTTAAPPSSPPPGPPQAQASVTVASPSLAAVPSPVAVPSPASAGPSPSPKPSVVASPSPPAVGKPSVAQLLPTVERSKPPSSAAFLTPADLELELQEPITSADQLRDVVDGMAELNGITHVASDGVHLSFEYDSNQVLPARIRSRLEELGHPAKAGTEIQNPGETAD